MPLFFFLSGLLSYAVLPPPILLNKIKKRILGQLLPTLSTGILFVGFMLDARFMDALFDKSKGGYWFTYVAVIIYLLYAGFAFAFYRFQWNIKKQTILCVGISMLMFPLSYLINRSGFSAHPICRLLSLVNIVSFTPFFLMGVLVKMHWGAFHRWIENEWFISMVLVVYTGLLAARAMTDLELKLVVYAIPAVLIIYTLFHCFQSIFSSSTMVGASLIYIGKRTLAIYLVHYFLLSGVAPAVLLPIIHKYGGWITGFVAQMLLALIVTGVSLLIEAILRKATPLYRLLLGYPN